MKLTGSQIRQARAHLRISQEQLAKAAGVHANTIVKFESGTVAPHESTRNAIQQALEARGIVFTNGDLPGFHYDKSKVIIPT